MSESTNQKIDRLIEIIGRIAAPIPAIPAIQPIPPIPAIPPLAPINTADHDLLLRVDTKLATLQTSVDKLVIASGGYITRDEHNQVLKTESDQEARIRAIEKSVTIVMTWGSALVVGLSIAQFVIGHFWN